MSCPFEQEVLLLDSEQPERRRVFLEDHVRSCDLCGTTRDSLREMRAVVRMSPIHNERAGARAEIFERIEKKQRTVWMQPIFAVAAVSLVAVIVALARPAPDEELGITKTHPAGTQLVIGSGEVMVATPATVRVEHGGVELDHGKVELVVVPSPNFTNFFADTPHASVRLVEGSLTLDVSRAATVVQVIAGVADVELEGHAHRLSAGQQLRAPVLDAVQQAKDTLAADPPRAAELALDILKTTPAPAIEARALAVVADAKRRSGQLEEAAEWYEKLANHPHGAAFIEEAVYQRARVLRALNRRKEAVASLQRTMPSTALLPERLALEAELNEDLGQNAEAGQLYRAAARAARDAGDPRTAFELEKRAQQR